ncbi:YmdB family metallophosphoesterase [Mycoplasma sp. Pen4]|nr:YmdB family metallophosphoesterase [Mycoplasma sp. Pen4]
MNNPKKLKVLAIGDIFGAPGVETVEKILPELIKDKNIDFVIAQAENATGRKGLGKEDLDRLKKVGINAFTMGNHVWAQQEIYDFIDNEPVIRPYNINETYPGKGTIVFDVKGTKVRVTSMMGIVFNELNRPWTEQSANNFFDAADKIINSDFDNNDEVIDYHLIDFHAETTSEKYVFSLYLDGKVDAIWGTHTHVQTNDAHILPNGTAYVTDLGMVGPMDCAIGANFEEVYRKMRFNSKDRFVVSPNSTQFNAALITLDKINGNSIESINISNVIKK